MKENRIMIHLNRKWFSPIGKAVFVNHVHRIFFIFTLKKEIWYKNVLERKMVIVYMELHRISQKNFSFFSSRHWVNNNFFLLGEGHKTCVNELFLDVQSRFISLNSHLARVPLIHPNVRNNTQTNVFQQTYASVT